MLGASWGSASNRSVETNLKFQMGDFKLMHQKIEGIFTPTIVPLDERREINEVELRRYIDWLFARGVHGIYPNGSTGEMIRFTSEERRRITKIVCEQADGKGLVLAGAAEENVRETL